jgi:Rod binding domain-containing protein
MSIDYSLSSLNPTTTSLDLSSVQGTNVPDKTRIEKVSKAMESLFVGQLTAELGKGIDDTDGTDATKESSPYSDFIQQAMTQGVSQGGGLGLAKVIENYLNHGNQTAKAHQDLTAATTTIHVKPLH